MTLALIATFACVAAFVPKHSPRLDNRNILANYPQLKVHIVSIETRQINKLIDLHNRNIESYANLHNYTYLFVPKIQSNLPVYWWKIELVLATLRNNPELDYCLWVDTDAIFQHNWLPLNVLIQNDENACIIIGKDRPHNENGSLYCTGVFLVKNAKVSMQFLEDCLSVYQARSVCQETLDGLNSSWAGRCYEQGVANELLMNEYASICACVHENLISNSSNMTDAFIVHIWGDKMAALKKFRFAIAKHLNDLPLTRNPHPVSLCVLLMEEGSVTGNLPTFYFNPTVSQEFIAERLKEYELVIKVDRYWPELEIFRFFIPSGTDLVVKADNCIGCRPELLPIHKFAKQMIMSQKFKVVHLPLVHPRVLEE
jgi:hypothetical protein